MNLHFRKIGEGQPLIILHGLFGSSDNWQSHAKKFAENFCVYLVDQRNHGHSPHDATMNYDAMADDLLELIAAEGLRDVILLGHSMGGKTVMRFAQKNAFLVDRMIVVDMGIKQYRPHHDLIFQGLFHVDVDHVKSRKEAEERLTQFVTEASTVQFLMKNLYWKTPEQLAWRFNLDVLNKEINAILSAMPNEIIDTPTLMLTGGQSGYVPAKDFDSIAELIPNAEFKVIESAGHWVHAEAPAAFIEAVETYLL
ncbi:MAG: alpha/beta fold hydrolase [Flavobacteriales bacterium]|jgi:esterase